MQCPQVMRVLLMGWGKIHLKLEGVQVQCCLWPEASGCQGSMRWWRYPQNKRERQRGKGRRRYQACMPTWQFFSVSARSCWNILWSVMVLNIEWPVLWAVSRTLSGKGAYWFFFSICPTFSHISFSPFASWLLWVLYLCFLSLKKTTWPTYTAMPHKGKLHSQTHKNVKYLNGPERNYKEHSLACP